MKDILDTKVHYTYTLWGARVELAAQTYPLMRAQEYLISWISKHQVILAFGYRNKKYQSSTHETVDYDSWGSMETCRRLYTLYTHEKLHPWTIMLLFLSDIYVMLFDEGGKPIMRHMSIWWQLSN